MSTWNWETSNRKSEVSRLNLKQITTACPFRSCMHIVFTLTDKVLGACCHYKHSFIRFVFFHVLLEIVFCYLLYEYHSYEVFSLDCCIDALECTFIYPTGLEFLTYIYVTVMLLLNRIQRSR